jgi:predicted Zn-dependent protease
MFKFKTLPSHAYTIASLFLGLFLCVFPSTLLFSSPAHELPELGQSGAKLSPRQEKEIGLEVLGEIRRYLNFESDPYIQDYIQSIGQKLVSTHTQVMEYDFFVVNDHRINAFALPGGFIGVNTGIILNADSESELASVMAHEVSHVRLRHIAQLYEHANKVQISAIAGMLAAVVLATQSPEAAQGALAIATAASTQSMINFTRENEKEADQEGLQALARAGFDPKGMPHFFQKLQKGNHFHDPNSAPEFLRTHPLTESRIQSALSQAKRYPYKQVADPLAFYLVKAKLQHAQFSSAKQAEHYFLSHLKRGTYQSKIATQYGYALSLIDQKEHLKAKELLVPLAEKYPNESAFQLALANIHLQAGDTLGAIAQLQNHLTELPQNRATTLQLCSLLLSLQKESPNKNHLFEVKKLLLFALKRYPKGDKDLLELLSRTYYLEGDLLNAHLAESKARELNGEYVGAIIQLKQASKISTLTSRQVSQLESRVEELKRHIPENKKNKHHKYAQ